MIRQLQIVLKDVPPWKSERHQQQVTLPQSLWYCLRKGMTQPLWDASTAIRSLLPWQQSLLHALPPELRAAGLAPAELQWRGEGGELRAGTWMQVQLVNVIAGMSDVHIALLRSSPDDECTLMQTLQPLLLLSGFELHQSPVGHWYVWSEKILNVETLPLVSSLTTNSYDVMPRGSDAQTLRRLMTEIQMLLHQHPVNHTREQASNAPLNALWFSGAGSPLAAASGTLQRIMSDTAYVRGLCDQLNVTCWPVPRDANDLLTWRDQDMLLVLSAVDMDQLDGWLRGLLAHLHAGAIENLHIHVDDTRVSMKGGRWAQLRRWLSRSSKSVEALS